MTQSKTKLLNIICLTYCIRNVFGPWARIFDSDMSKYTIAIDVVVATVNLQMRSNINPLILGERPSSLIFICYGCIQMCICYFSLSNDVVGCLSWSQYHVCRYSTETIFSSQYRYVAVPTVVTLYWQRYLYLKMLAARSTRSSVSYIQSVMCFHQIVFPIYYIHVHHIFWFICPMVLTRHNTFNWWSTLLGTYIMRLGMYL